MGILDDIENSNWAQQIGNLLTGNPIDQTDQNIPAIANNPNNKPLPPLQSVNVGDAPPVASVPDQSPEDVAGNAANATGAAMSVLGNNAAANAGQAASAMHPGIAAIFGQDQDDNTPDFQPTGLQKLAAATQIYGQNGPGGYEGAKQAIVNNNLKNYTDQAANDPNSPVSQMAQQLAGKYIPGIDPNTLKNLSSSDIIKAIPTIAPIIQQQSSQLMQGSKDLQGIVQQGITGIDAAKSSSRNALGIENTKIHTGQQLMGDIDAALSGKNGVVADPSLMRALTTDFASYLSGGGGRIGQGQIDELAQHTFGTDAASALEYISNNPQDAKAQGFLQNMKAMIQNQQEGLQQRMESDIAKPLASRLQELDQFAQTHPNLKNEVDIYKQQLIQQSEISPNKLQQKNGVYTYTPGTPTSQTTPQQGKGQVVQLGGKSYNYINGQYYPMG